MLKELPEFLLFADAESNEDLGRWHFSLESVDNSEKITAEDEERVESETRLELLAVLRGLEALDQPSSVTLVTTSAYVRRGIRFGIEEWRSNNWRWERFGIMVPITNGDLWQRIDQAMRFHEVKCRSWKIERHDEAHGVDNAHVLRGPHRNRARIGVTKRSEVQKQAS